MKSTKFSRADIFPVKPTPQRATTNINHESSFLDTVGMIALWDHSDQWHAAASAQFATILLTRVPLFTTRFVMLECGNAAARRTYRLDVDFLRQSLESRKRLIEPTDADWDEAWDAYASGSFGQAGIVDQVSFVVMRRLGITAAFTNDNHFRTAGFTVLF